MESETVKRTGNELGVLNLVVLVLSVYVLGALLVDHTFTLPTETLKLLMYIDNAICVFFVIEFSVRFYQADNKLKFMRWGWIDLVSCVPMVDYARAGRLLRLIRLLRVIRAFRSTQRLINHIFANRAKGTFTMVAVFAVVVVIFSSIAILQVETDPKSNIRSAEDAIWWAYVTVTTVGYGDKYPVTTEGRILAAFLMTAGVGLFGTYTAYVASWFASGRKRDEMSGES